MRALLSKQEEPSLYRSTGNYFSHVLRSILPTSEKRPKVRFALFLKTRISTNEAYVSSSFTDPLQRVFILFRWNLTRMLPNNVAKKTCRGTFIFGLLRKLWVFKQRQCVFCKNLKFNSVLKTNQTCNQNSPTWFFKSRCEETVAMSLPFSR